MPNTIPPSDPAHLRVLDSLRLRLSAANNALAQTRAQVENSDPLPLWTSLQQSLHLSTSALADLAATLSTNHDMLASMHAFPLPTYPSTGSEGVPMAENVRQQLMRKKLEPLAEDLVESGIKFMDHRQEQGSGPAIDDEDEMNELWDWAADLVPSLIMKQAWNADYTNDELERGYRNVPTGLKRKLNHDRAEQDDDDEDDDDSSEGDVPDDNSAMQVDGVANAVGKDEHQSRAPPALSVEEMLRYTHRGSRAAGVAVR